MKQTILFLLSATTLITINDAFTVTSPIPLSSSLSSSNEDEAEPSLIIGSDMSEAIQGLGSEAGYLDYSKKRNEEAKLKMLEQVRLEEEEAERKRQARENNTDGGSANYGPGDLSGFVGFKDDGFENSEGNDSTGGWGEVREGEAEGTEEEEPKLFLFGDDDDTGASAGGLIL